MRLLLAVLLLIAPAASAQIFPDLTGDDLLDALDGAYAPNRVLSSSQSKDRLYDTVDEATVGGQRGVLGFYTDFFVPFDGQPSSDPSQDVFNNNAGINQEHVWPRSEGTDNNNAETDMHHLVPTRVRVNSDRASLPFAEIPDAQAVAWYRFDQTQSSTPTADRDAYSERSSSAFEPREVVKGDVARMLFYVATIYEAEVGSGGLRWFDRQLGTLLDWHDTDPADEAEVARSGRVASFQGNDNPFVLDATLARRAFAPATASTNEAQPKGLRLVGPFPNPTEGRASISVVLDAPGDVQIALFDALGRRVALLHDGILGTGPHAFSTTPSLASGTYILRVVTPDGIVTRRLTQLER
ncbi:MAG: endonuclease [Bacteroidota bacterium]